MNCMEAEIVESYQILPIMGLLWNMKEEKQGIEVKRSVLLFRKNFLLYVSLPFRNKHLQDKLFDNNFVKTFTMQQAFSMHPKLLISLQVK